MEPTLQDARGLKGSLDIPHEGGLFLDIFHGFPNKILLQLPLHY